MDDMSGKKHVQKTHKSPTETLLQKVVQKYGTKKTPEEIAFINEIEKKIDKNGILLFILTVWVGIVSYSKVFMIQCEHSKISRCMVPDLEGHFSYEQILNLSVRFQDEYRHNCYYDKRNYTNYIKMYGYNYSAIMDAISKSHNAYSQRCSRTYVTKFLNDYDNLSEVRNFQDEINIYCESHKVKRMIATSLKYGQFILSIPLGILGDFHGRKTAFLFCGGVFTSGVICTLSYHFFFEILGRFLIGSSMILFYTVFVIFVENTSVNGRRMAILLHEGFAIGRFVEYILYRTLGKWKIAVIINVVMCPLMLVSYICFKESARWIYFRGNQKKAYSIIGIEKPEAPTVLNQKKMKSHLKMILKPMFRRRLIIQMITIGCTSSIVFLIRTKFSSHITNYKLKQLLDSGALKGSCTFLTFMLICFIGSRRSIMLYVTITSFVHSILLLNTRMDHMLIQILLTVTVTLAENATFLAFCRISEFYSNDIRLTCYGICCGVHSFGEIFYYYIPMERIYYTPLFFSSSLSLIILFFQVDSPAASVLPDYPREALKETDLKSILRAIDYEKRKT